MIPKNVKPKSGWWKLIPWLSNHTATTFYPNIYVPEAVFRDLLSESPNHHNLGLLEHELVHLNRAKQHGVFKHLVKYILFPKFRYQEEIEAHKVAMKYYKSNNLEYKIEFFARSLSGWIYLWQVSYQKAAKDLNAIWQSL